MKWKQGLQTYMYTPEPLWDYSWFHLLLKILLHNWAPRQQSLWIRPCISLKFDRIIPNCIELITFDKVDTMIY